MANGFKTCPPLEELEGLAVGSTTSDDVREHAETCPQCRRALERIREDNQFLVGFLADGTWRAAAAGAPMPHIDIPGYEIVREVHRGGQGVVYQAVQHSTKREVAIKMMKQGPFATLSDRARFDREIETLGRLDHPNIVTVYDAGMIAGFQYFVMDYIDGAPLDEALANGAAELDAGEPARVAATTGKHGFGRGAPIAQIASVLETFIKVCDAVNAAHLRGVIHRDLKPSNIRVDRSGEPHVLDFGLAKQIESEDSAMTHTGQFVGSLPWASPEQVEGVHNRIDIRTDVYSLGAILYQLFAGVPPFDTGSNLRETLDAILGGDPPRPSLLAAARGVKLDNELETIILKCLSKDRERRYQSAGELARDLRRYLSGDVIDAKRDSAWYLIRKAAWRKRRILIAAAAPMLLLPIAAYALHRSVTEARLADRERTLREVEAKRNAAMLEIARRFHARPGSAPDSPGERLSRLNAAVVSADLDGGSLSVSDYGVAMLLAETLRDRGRIVEAEGFVRRALFMLQRDYGANHPEIGRIRTVLAELLRRRGNRMSEAQQTAERAIEELTRAFGSAGADVARGWITVARIKLARGDAPGALEATLEALSAEPNPRSITRAEAHATRAEVRAKSGDFEQARRDFLSAMRSMLELTHDTDARLLDVLNLGAGLVKTHVLSAEELLDRAQLRGKLAELSGSDALIEIAAVLRGGADGTARDELIAPARLAMVAARERLLGPEHPSLGASLASAATMIFVNTLGEGGFDEQATRESLAMLERAIPLQIAVHGPDSPLVGKSYETMAACLVELCRLEEATHWYALDCELWMRQPPALRDEYQIMLRARWTAWHATRAGDYEAALSWIDRSLEMILRLVGRDHPGSALMYACKAYCTAALGREVEAQQSAELAERTLNTQAVPEDQRLECRRFLGSAYLLTGRLDDARATIEPAWRAAQLNFGRQRPFVRCEWSKTMLAYCRAIGDDERAAEFEQLLRQCRAGGAVRAIENSPPGDRVEKPECVAPSP